MRLWSIHPKYLDSKGLVALWREALLAQKVLLGNTKGYQNHPQLLRFKWTKDPIAAISQYLLAVAEEADCRGYHFNKNKILNTKTTEKISVTTKQIEYEFKHLLEKLKNREIKRFEELQMVKRIEIHGLFYEIDGPIESWEKQKG
ncbi:MAG: pyrimidine dimer DNA glycosylase/endonuclease V [Lentisphaeria bacterium]